MLFQFTPAEPIWYRECDVRLAFRRNEFRSIVTALAAAHDPCRNFSAQRSRHNPADSSDYRRCTFYQREQLFYWQFAFVEFDVSVGSGAYKPFRAFLQVCNANNRVTAALRDHR